MAELHYVHEGNKPQRGDKVDIIIQGSQMFLCSEHPNVWIELRVNSAEKTSLMKTLVKDFLEV